MTLMVTFSQLPVRMHRDSTIRTLRQLVWLTQPSSCQVSLLLPVLKTEINFSTDPPELETEAQPGDISREQSSPDDKDNGDREPAGTLDGTEEMAESENLEDGEEPPQLRLRSPTSPPPATARRGNPLPPREIITPRLAVLVRRLAYPAAQRFEFLRAYLMFIDTRLSGNIDEGARRYQNAVDLFRKCRSPE
jgi:hypothetical protein